MQLGGIADHDERRLGSARLETDVRGERAADQLERLGHDMGEVDRRALAALAAAVGEDLLDQRATAGRGDEHVLRIALERRATGRFLDEHFAVGEHTRQDIVEVVRDAAGEPPDRFHLLRLAQPLLEPLALGLRELPLGNIAEIHHHGLHAGFMKQVPRRRLDPPPRPVLVPHHHLACRYVVRILQQLRPGVCRVLPMVLMEWSISDCTVSSSGV